MTFVKEAWLFVLPFVVLALALTALGRPRWAAVAGVTAVLVLLFFRSPARSSDGGDDIVLAAADGRVTAVDRVEDPDLGPGSWKRVVTFLSVFDVHVQRAPVAGRVVSSTRRPGRKVAAFRSDAGEVNASLLTVIERPGGEIVGMRQIAGLLARRAVSYVVPDQQVARGELIGVIKFGSRVDLLLPERYQIQVAVGDRLRTGETVVAVAEVRERPVSDPPVSDPAASETATEPVPTAAGAPAGESR